MTDIADAFHRWYYDSQVWAGVRYLGIPCLKSVMDLWNYQEIMVEREPALVVEFGTYHGGATMFFADMLQKVRSPAMVLSVDVDHGIVEERVQKRPDIELMTMSSLAPAVAERIAELRRTHPGPMFAILDSDHSMANVLSELKVMRDLTRPGDYVIVEDSNINGHPVLPGWGPGPMEAIAAYEREFPDDYIHDRARENKYGFTFAPNGFLIRR